MNSHMTPNADSPRSLQTCRSTYEGGFRLGAVIKSSSLREASWIKRPSHSTGHDSRD